MLLFSTIMNMPSDRLIHRLILNTKYSSISCISCRPPERNALLYSMSYGEEQILEEDLLDISVEPHRFVSRSDQTKDYKIGICCFSA